MIIRCGNCDKESKKYTSYEQIHCMDIIGGFGEIVGIEQTSKSIKVEMHCTECHAYTTISVTVPDRRCWI